MVFRRSNSLRPVNSIKHVVDSQLAVPGNSQVFVTLAEGVYNAVLTEADECEVGSKINAIFLNVQVISTAETALNNVYFMVFKNPSGGLTPPSANIVGTSEFKKFVIHQEMVMLSDPADSIPSQMFKGVIVLPRHMRRMAIGDELRIAFFSPGAGNTQNACVQCIYKEFR